MSGFYSYDELMNLGFGSIGKNCKISKKTSFYGISNIYIGNNTRIDDFCIISTGKSIKIGNFVHISAGVSIFGKEEIIISDFSSLSGKVSVYSSTDDFSGEYMANPCVGEYNNELINVYSSPIYIGKHVIIGCGSVILPNAYITDGVSIGCLSMVNKKINDIGIYAGVPIKFIKEKKLNFFELEKTITL